MAEVCTSCGVAAVEDVKPPKKTCSYCGRDVEYEKPMLRDVTSIVKAGAALMAKAAEELKDER